MKKIFALQGVSNCGKTSTLNSLNYKFQKKYGQQPTFSQTYKKPTNKGISDICVIYNITDGNGNTLIIGIASQGDELEKLKKGLKLLVSENCDIIFCACRTKGKTIDYIHELSKEKNYVYYELNTTLFDELIMWLKQF